MSRVALETSRRSQKVESIGTGHDSFDEFVRGNIHGATTVMLLTHVLYFWCKDNVSNQIDVVRQVFTCFRLSDRDFEVTCVYTWQRSLSSEIWIAHGWILRVYVQSSWVSTDRKETLESSVDDRKYIQRKRESVPVRVVIDYSCAFVQAPLDYVAVDTRKCARHDSYKKI